MRKLLMYISLVCILAMIVSSSSNLEIYHTKGDSGLQLYSNQAYYNFSTGLYDNTSAVYIYNHDKGSGGDNYTIRPLTISTQGHGDSHVLFERYDDKMWWSKTYLSFTRANGTFDEPTRPINNNQIGGITWGAYNGTYIRDNITSVSSSVGLIAQVESNTTPGTKVPLKIRFYFTNESNYVTNWTWNKNGELKIGSTNYNDLANASIDIRHTKNNPAIYINQTGADNAIEIDNYGVGIALLANSTGGGSVILAAGNNSGGSAGLFRQYNNSVKIIDTALGSYHGANAGSNRFWRNAEITSPIVSIENPNITNAAIGLQINTDNTGSPLRILKNSTSVTCDLYNEGGIYYDGTAKKFYGCDGTTWNELG